MKLKEIYVKNKNRRFNYITKVKKENLKLEINPIQSLKSNWIMILALIIGVIAILLIDFNPKFFIASLVLIGIIIAVFIFGNKSLIFCDKDLLTIKQGFQTVNVPYNNLRNVYIGKVNGLLFFLPAFTYNIIIRYEDNFGFLRELEFSLLCADEQDVENFINNFEVNEQIEERCVKFERRKFAKKILYALSTIIVFIIIALYFIPRSGINFNQII